MRVLELRIPGRDWATCPIPIPTDLSDYEAIRLAETSTGVIHQLFGSDPRFKPEFRIVEGPVQ